MTVAEATAPTIRALHTDYAGFTFRSRTEARWAVFLDALGVRWDYEPQAYSFGGQRYLPDFWLPTQGRWLEVKGGRPDGRAREKCQWLADGTGQPVLVVWGEPRPPCLLAEVAAELPGEADQALVFTSGWDDYAHWWCLCPYCGLIDVAFQGWSGRLRCRCVAARYGDDAKAPTHDRPLLKAAYARARSAFTGPTFNGQHTSRYESLTS